MPRQMLKCRICDESFPAFYQAGKKTKSGGMMLVRHVREFHPAELEPEEDELEEEEEGGDWELPW